MLVRRAKSPNNIFATPSTALTCSKERDIGSAEDVAIEKKWSSEGSNLGPLHHHQRGSQPRGRKRYQHLCDGISATL
jgi:hypothetical protein